MKYLMMKKLFSDRIIDWYIDNKRDLPWRDTKDPYRIWISEIILQQTRVAQGYNYFLRFMKRFPDILTLASATEDEVMYYWQGLGYYSRARNLHAAARSMKSGIFPKTYQEVRALSGVGDYTAAAICSFAYDMPYAVVDGNVYRVLSRYLGIDEPIDSTQGKKLFAAMANEYLVRSQSALYNQAIMDFGAVQCVPASPKCIFCPLIEDCVAAREGRTAQLPVKQHRTKVTNRYFTYLYIYIGSDVLIHKRTGHDIWRNLYEFPLIESKAPLMQRDLLASDEFTRFIPLGIEPQVDVWKLNVKHVLTHRIIYADFYRIHLPFGVTFPSDFQLIPRAALADFAFPQLIQSMILNEK